MLLEKAAEGLGYVALLAEGVDRNRVKERL